MTVPEVRVLDLAKFKETKDWKDFQKYLKQFDWDEMARQHHGDLEK